MNDHSIFVVSRRKKNSVEGDLYAFYFLESTLVYPSESHEIVMCFMITINEQG
jgi:hypothetical protein